MNITKQKGLMTELQCQIAFSNLGFIVSQPICDDSRYDFIIDINGDLIKIQCKTCSLLEDNTGITFSTRSCRINSNGVFQRKYTKNEIDYFYTYYDGKSYLIKVEETSSSSKTLRFSNPHNLSNVSYAKDYELEYILKKDFECVFHYNEVNTKSSSLYKTTCPQCGGEMRVGSKMCRKCNDENKKTNPSVDKETLLHDILSMSMLQVAKKYSVSNTTIKNWCKKYNIPFKKEDKNILK